MRVTLFAESLFGRVELLEAVIARVDKVCRSEIVGSRAHVCAAHCLMWLFVAGDLPFRFESRAFVCVCSHLSWHCCC